MKYNILNRWTLKVQFVAEIECSKDTPESVKLGLALRNAVLSGAVLRNADLSGAVLSDADLSGADLRDADLSGAVLSGADLSGADLSGAVLRNAVLSGADLSGAVLSGAVLSGADLSGADLRDADLSGAVLSGADLSDADLSGAVLSGADLSGADLSDAVLRNLNLKGVPVIKKIHQTIYKAVKKEGALDMSSWHSCDTTHCRAGWVVTLAGEAGKAMEYRMGTPAAAALIYLASDPTIEKIPDFYCGNEAAMADIKRLAEQEKAA